MRRIALALVLVGALVAAATAWAAVTNTVSYKVTMKSTGKGTKKKPAALQYKAVLHVDTDPPGQQPDTSPNTTIYFPKEVKQNAKYIPSCKQSDIDGKATIPAKCNKALVGTGTASALAGTPGQDASSSIKEDLTVKLFNGGPKEVLLVLNASQPVQVQNAVVPGILGAGEGGYGYTVDFQVPPSLQNNTGLWVALTDFNVNVTPKNFPVKVKGKKVKLSYLQLTAPCKGLKSKATAHFIDENGQPAGEVSDEEIVSCG